MENKYAKDFIDNESSIMELYYALNEGRITSKELVTIYLERIAEFDKSDPKINSIIEINPDALHLAEAMDNERRLGKLRGFLHGIPVLIKDNISTKDKMHTSAGSLALKDSYVPYDAFIVKQLREAGAIILGKTNLTEFANFMTENMPSGYSSRGGQVLNPYGPGIFDVGGSSAGSAAAVASNFCSAAVGTETSGSILNPSVQNSIVGIKPTLGLISRTGIIPIAHSQDTAGPMARTVEDAVLLLNGLTGIDEKDPATLISNGKSSLDYTKFLDKDGLKGARIGLPRKYFEDDLSDEEKALYNDAVNCIQELGGILIDPADIESVNEINDIDVLIYEFKSGINAYLSSLGSNAPVKSLREIIEYNETNSEKTLKYGQTILVQSENTSGNLTEPEYINARLRDIRLSSVEGIDRVLQEYKLDAILFPSFYGCDIAARAGYPSITVPAGYKNTGEPFGITFTAGAFSEPTLIKLAYSYEQRSRMRKPPKIANK